MKKWMLALLCAGSMATVVADDVPQVHFGVLENDVSGKATLNAISEIQRGRGDRVCWVANNFPVGTELLIEETFRSPPGGVFQREDTVTQSNATATEHVLSYKATVNGQKQFMQCWAFGDDDPIGLYTHSLRVNGEEFSPNEFQLTR